MSTQLQAIDIAQTKLVNATARVVPMHLQIQALKLLVRAKKKIFGIRQVGKIHAIAFSTPTRWCLGVSS